MTVVDDFPDQNILLPTVALELDTIDGLPFEMGNRQFGTVRRWYIDVFAENKAQRDEYAFRIFHALENKINVYDFDQGFDDPPKIGILDPEDVQLRVIKVLPELTELMYYRTVVTFTAVYETI